VGEKKRHLAALDPERTEELARTNQRAEYVAYVDVVAEDVLSIEDLPVQNPKAGVGHPEEPLRHNIGSIVQLRGAGRPVKLAVLRDDFRAAVTNAIDNGHRFVTFPWVDPNNRTGI